MSNDSRKQLMVEFMQSYRATGQLFYKLLHTATQEEPAYSMACLPILKALKQEGSMSQSAIARELHHSDAAISRQIKLLAEDELISTRPDVNNRRASIVEMTEKGETTLKQFESSVINLLTDILAEMPDDRLRQLIDSNKEIQQIITSKMEKEQ